MAWLILAGLLILWGLFAWERRLEEEGKEPLVSPSMFRNRQLDSGLTMFLFQFFIQAGIFFTIPLFLSIVLELSALQTGIQLIPLSLSLLVSAIGVPKLWPKASPRRVVRIGLLLLANPSIPASLKADAQTTFGAGVPFLSYTAVRTGLEAYGASQATIQELLHVNADARLAALRAALFIVVLAAALALFFTRRIPSEPPGTPAEVPEDQKAFDPQDRSG